MHTEACERGKGSDARVFQLKGYLWDMIGRCFFHCVVPNVNNEKECKQNNGLWASGPQVCVVPW